MKSNIVEKIPLKYRNYKINEIESGASDKLFYRIANNNNSYILIDFNNEKKDYQNFINVHSTMSNINVSVPNIFEADESNYLLITEDFGNQRFDKILNIYSLKELLQYAVQNLIIFKNNINYNIADDLITYDYSIFKSEISELPIYYYKHIHGYEISIDLVTEFYECWKKYFNSIKFEFSYFAHKDFNINNLMYLPQRKKHLKCGILDFQSAFWGECCWDLFSLLEDSRIFFDDQYNDYFIKNYYISTNQNISFKEFEEKYYFLNCSRQTRLLGRWVKLSQEINNSFYLDFIKTTKKRLLKSLYKLNKKDLISIYNKLVPDIHL